jgi:hypothetical protein
MTPIAVEISVPRRLLVTLLILSLTLSAAVPVQIGPAPSGPVGEPGFEAPFAVASVVAASAPSDEPAELPLSNQQLEPALTQAIGEWQTAVPSSDLSAVTANVADLPDLELARTVGTSITVDPFAAGHGWSVVYVDGAPRMDLLTVLRHELGHVLGYEHTDTGLMAPTLAPGESHLVEVPTVEDGSGTEPATDEPCDGADGDADHDVQTTMVVDAEPMLEPVIPSTTESTGPPSDESRDVDPEPPAPTDTTEPPGGAPDLDATSDEGVRLLGVEEPTEGDELLDGFVTMSALESSACNPNEVCIDGGPLDDLFTLSMVDGEVHVSNSNPFTVNGYPYYAPTSFSVPSTSIRIRGGGGNDTVRLSGTIALTGVDIAVDAEVIEVLDGASVTSRDLSLEAFASGTGLGPSTQTLSASVGVLGAITGRHIILTALVEHLVNLTDQVLNGLVALTLTTSATVNVAAPVTAETLTVAADTRVTFHYDGTAPTTTPSGIWEGVALPDGEVRLTLKSVTTATVSGTPLTITGTSAEALAVSARDEIDVVVTIADASGSTRLLQVPASDTAAYFDFDRLLVDVTASRTTSASVVGTETTPVVVTAASGGIDLSARSTGRISGTVDSDLVGTVRIAVPTDVAQVTLQHARVNAAGLAVAGGDGHRPHRCREGRPQQRDRLGDGDPPCTVARARCGRPGGRGHRRHRHVGRVAAAAVRAGHAAGVARERRDP